jgi:hypothetical protein
VDALGARLTIARSDQDIGANFPGVLGGILDIRGYGKSTNRGVFLDFLKVVCMRRWRRRKRR